MFTSPPNSRADALVPSVATVEDGAFKEVVKFK